MEIGSLMIGMHYYYWLMNGDAHLIVLNGWFLYTPYIAYLAPPWRKPWINFIDFSSLTLCLNWMCALMFFEVLRTWTYIFCSYFFWYTIVQKSICKCNQIHWDKPHVYHLVCLCLWWNSILHHLYQEPIMNQQ